MPSIKFTRDTTPREGKKPFKKGDVAEMPGASARHWINRNAAVEVKSTDPAPQSAAAHTRMVHDMQHQLSEIANAQPTPVVDPAADGGRVGNRTEPDPASGGSSSESRTGRHSRK